MDSRIPEEFLHVTKSSTSDFLEDGKVVVAICTASGQLLEFVDNRVTDYCDINRVADEITVFTSYEPLQKYYLLHCQKQLIVVKRRKPLCIVKKYDDVLEVKIRDMLEIGRPQVVIRTETDGEPIVTDFVGQLKASVPHALPPLIASLTGKLQEMNARVAKVGRLVQEKRNTRYKALYRFTPHLLPPQSGIQSEPQVLAWGPPLPAVNLSPDPPLRMFPPWTKVHNGKWIIGIPVFNTTTTAVCDVSLRLRQSSAGEAEPRLGYQSLLMGFGQRNTSGAQWTEPHHSRVSVQKLVNIAGRSSAVVVGVLKEPLFKNNPVISLSGSILYKRNNLSEGVVQDLLSTEINLNVEGLIEGSHVPFSPQNTPDESDLVSVIVSSLSWQLCVSPRHRITPPLVGAFEKAGLLQAKELGCWVRTCAAGGSMAGLMVIESEITSSSGGYSLLVYAREMKQLLLFVHSLKSHWKVGVCNESTANVQDCISSLKAELCTLRSIVRPGAQYTVEEWGQIRDKLSGMELTTDMKFSSYLS